MLDGTSWINNKIYDTNKICVYWNSNLRCYIFLLAINMIRIILISQSGAATRNEHLAYDLNRDTYTYKSI